MEFNGFTAGRFEDILEIAYRLLAAALGAFIPLNVVAAFRMMFIMSGDHDVIAHDFAALFEHRNKLPVSVQQDFLEHVDALGVSS